MGGLFICCRVAQRFITLWELRVYCSSAAHNYHFDNLRLIPKRREERVESWQKESFDYVVVLFEHRVLTKTPSYSNLSDISYLIVQ
jgi:hypothetical protein